jgi:nucleotide-binding universal stress UspA family protein
MTRIVVGVDGSPHSKRALIRAIQEAQLRDGTVDAVYAFTPPKRALSDDLIGMSYGRMPAGGQISPDAPAHHPPSKLDEATAEAESQLKIFVDEALVGFDGPRPRLVVVPESHPAEALIDLSRAADLLVVGTRGLGGFTGMLVGSVAHQCIQHAKCPILVLPPED